VTIQSFFPLTFSNFLLNNKTLRVEGEKEENITPYIDNMKSRLATFSNVQACTQPLVEPTIDKPCSELYTSMPDSGITIYLDVTSLDTTVERDRELNSLPIERFCSETCMPDTTQRSRNKTQRQIKSYRSTETLASHTVVNRRNHQYIIMHTHSLHLHTHSFLGASFSPVIYIITKWNKQHTNVNLIALKTGNFCYTHLGQWSMFNMKLYSWRDG